MSAGLSLQGRLLKSAQDAPAGSLVDRRRHRRVRIGLSGRFMLPDRKEYTCHVIDISAGGLAIATNEVGNVDDRVIAYLDEIGRLEGRISRVFEGGFAVALANGQAKREKIVAKLTWLANKVALKLEEGRQHQRFTPKSSRSTLRMEDGSVLSCRVRDISASGANLVLNVVPPSGSSVHLGNIPATVLRPTDGGAILLFKEVLNEASLEERLAATI